MWGLCQMVSFNGVTTAQQPTGDDYPVLFVAEVRAQMG